MSTRREFLLALLGITVGASALRAAPESAGEFYMKVLRVDGAKGELEAELSTPPKRTRILFTGEVGRVLEGEFVKFQTHNKAWQFGGKDMTIRKVTWIF